ncbi:copine [Catovirus CTV1]|uniref:Copine n=1 Tax=Catovirus CTV1 TaxID=1977631 RepID=A0A1V0SB49_9VIRU|nr:copine [Catovirus CTV1]
MGLIPAYGFGDIRTKNFKVFNINKNNVFCHRFNQVLDCYNEITPNIKLSGPTSFRPIIMQAIEIIKYTRSYHILVIVTDGEVIDKVQTEQAIVEASNYPLSIIVIGVGDGPFDNMEKYDDELPERKFDNFQFVNYNKILLECQNKNLPFESIFLLHAPQEIPDQYNYLKRNNMLTLSYANKVDVFTSPYEYCQVNMYPNLSNF